MKALVRNILVGLLCVGLLLVLAIGIYSKTVEPQSGLLKVSEDMNRAEIICNGAVYVIEGEKLEQLADFFRNLDVALYDVGTENEASGIVIQFFIGEVESDKFCVSDKETLIDYHDEEGDSTIDIYKTEVDVEAYLLEFIEEAEQDN